jgi:exonuclease SbcD
VLRIVHTSDWHLGHSLHDLPREREHAAFLAWLVDLLEAREIDALLVTGDVFDAANPPARAVAQWFEFLAAARARCPALDVVVIAGNHDSAHRLDAPDPVLRALGVHTVGALPRRGRELDPDRLVVPLRDRSGAVAAQVAAVPFLRRADLPAPQQPTDDPLIEGVREIYARALAAAREAREPGQALIATGHCYMVGTEVSRLSERRILGGNQHALPVSLFPDDVAYAALGHLHKPQRVGRDTVRYAGAPLPLAVDEARYRSSVVVVELEREAVARLELVPVPRAVELWQIPTRGPGSLAEVIATLEALPPRDPAVCEELRPYLTVKVALERPQPGLRREVERALAGRAPRLVKLEASYTGDGRALSESSAAADLRELDPEQVFLRRYRRDHREPLPPELCAAFAELLDAVHDEDRA